MVEFGEKPPVVYDAHVKASKNAHRKIVKKYTNLHPRLVFYLPIGYQIVTVNDGRV